jgi:hypothetical protein
MLKDSMKRYLAALLGVFVVGWCGACNSSTGSTVAGIVVNVSGSFKVVEAGGTPVTLTASVSGDPGNHGVTWTLSVANTNCSPACGTLKASGGAQNLSAVYTPPPSAPVNQQATITVRSMGDDRQVFAFNFQISAPISVSIAPKFNTQTAGGPVVDLTATLSNDLTNSGISWTLTAGGANCSPECGTLTVDAPPSLTAHYQPPATVPAGGSASPTITAASVADAGKSDSFTFTIVAPPISVSISNKFSTRTVGGSAVVVNAVLTNDAASAGVTWTLTSTAGACSPACGTLTADPAPSFSATYLPPATAPSGADGSPKITAASVTDPTKSDSFSFTIVIASALFKGSYAFQLRGFNASGAPMAMAGSISSDGSGTITGGELDLNDSGTVGHVSGLSGSYTVDTSFNSIPRLTITIAADANILGLKGALSSDGTRGRIIEYDGSLRLDAGSLLLQDAAALSAANPSGSYAFGLDSDAGTSISGANTTTGRIVEAGQFTLGPGGASVAGGVADAGQAGAPSPLFGGVTPASIAAGAATSPDSLGRGTLTLSINGNANSYAYYVVNSQQLNLIETDSGGTFATVQAGTAQRQKTLDANSINATSVVALTGTAVSGGTTLPSVIIGVLTVTGGTSASANYEYNAAGTVPPNQLPVSSAATFFSPFDPATGRAVVLNAFFFGAAAYLYDIGQGFLVDITPSSNGVNHAFSGPLTVQTPGPFSVPSDIAGNYIALAGGSSSPAIPNLDFAATFDAAGGYSSEVDFTNANLSIGSSGQAQNILRPGLYVLADPNVGRGTISFIPGIFGDFTSDQPLFGSFYVIGPRQLVVIGQGPLGSGVDPSGILFFDPQ